jgi:hypothetical protein
LRELRALEDSRGRLTPEQVIGAAQDKNSALHDCFTWDNSEAAAKWRLEEARELIRRVRIEVTVEERTIRTIAYVRDPQKPSGETGYVSTMKVRKREREDIIAEEIRGVIELCGRLLNILEAMPGTDEKREKIAAIIGQLESII